MRLQPAQFCPVSDLGHRWRVRTELPTLNWPHTRSRVELWRSQMAATANVLLREFPAISSQQLNKNVDVVLSANTVDRPGNVVKQHLILGTDKRDAEKQRDLWLSENPTIKIVKLHRVKREPQTLLTLIGSKHVPRVSIMVEYEEPNVDAE